MRHFRHLSKRLIARLIDHPLIERAYAHSPIAIKLQKEVKPNFKIGVAVLAYERPEYLELCLDSLFQTNLHSYDVTFLIQDDGSADKRVRRIIDRERDPRYKIVRSYTHKGHDSWGAAFNKAMHRLLDLDDFDILGSCDSDAFFHPEWLDSTLRIALWAKRNHREHILGPFSSFNSSDHAFHRILGIYNSPYGRYVVKRRMGALSYFYFKNDLLALGFFDECKDDETLMTARFEKLRVRNFCTETSYVEHIGRVSVLNQWRPTPVHHAVYGMNLAKRGWPPDIERVETLGYYKYVKDNVSFGASVSSETKIDVIIPAAEKDADVLPYTIDGARENIRHLIGRILIVAPESGRIRAIAEEKGCEFVHEDSVLPITRNDINYTVHGIDRSGWLFQQLLKWSGGLLSPEEYYLVLDADTVLIRPQVFVMNGKSVLLHSDEHHEPYFRAYRKLFGSDTPSHLSFVSHHMLFRRARVEKLKQAIERKHAGRIWYSAMLETLDRREVSAISEYELYGQWMLQNHPDEVIREYWFNVALKRNHLSHLPRLRRELAEKYRSVSFHNYME